MFYEWCKDAEVKEQWLQMERQLAALTVNRDTFGFIHNDNHAYNLLGMPAPLRCLILMWQIVIS
jgi:hypothetical protein